MPRTCGENGFEKVLLHPSKKKKEGFRKWKVCGEVGKRIAESGEKIRIIVSLYTDLCCPCINPLYSLITFCKERHTCVAVALCFSKSSYST